MSVCLSLYRINNDVTYNGYYLDFVSNDDFKCDSDGYYELEKLEASLGAPMSSNGHWPVYGVDDSELCDAHDLWLNAQKDSAWSDGKKHEKISLTMLKYRLGDYRACNRMLNRLNGLPFKIFNNGHMIERYIPVDEVLYRQGWFFKKSFFKKELPMSICVTKEQMLNFFNQYLDFSDPRGREVYESFVSSWEDGMIFECAW